MSGRPLIDMVKLSLAVPRGQEGYWAIIRKLDAKGPWSLGDVDRQSNVPSGAIRQYLVKLVAGGFAAPAGTRPATRANRPPVALYRLLRSPLLAPRLRADGRELPERQSDVLWRTMKMARAFTPAELAEFASSPDQPIDVATVRRYLRELKLAGVVAHDATTSTHEKRYRLVRNLGAQGPRILGTRVVYDPNARAVLGTPEAREVHP